MPDLLPLPRPSTRGAPQLVVATTAPGDVLFAATDPGEVYVNLVAWNAQNDIDHYVYVVLGSGPATALRLPMFTGRWSVLDLDVLGRRAGDENQTLSVYADVTGVVGVQWEAWRG